MVSVKKVLSFCFLSAFIVNAAACWNCSPEDLKREELEGRIREQEKKMERLLEEQQRERDRRMVEETQRRIDESTKEFNEYIKNLGRR